jgi:hypothetical protein
VYKRANDRVMTPCTNTGLKHELVARPRMTDEYLERPVKALTMLLASIAIFAIGVPCARADWSVAGFVGAAHTQDSSIRLIQPPDSTDVAISPVAYRAESFTSPIYYGYRVGFFPGSRWLGIEGEFIHLKVIAETSRPADIVGSLKGQTVSATQPIAAVLERFSITPRSESGTRQCGRSPSARRWRHPAALAHHGTSRHRCLCASSGEHDCGNGLGTV